MLRLENLLRAIQALRIDLLLSLEALSHIITI
jgi:hypothetical protein